MASKNPISLRICLPERVSIELKNTAEEKGLLPATMARIVICEHFKAKKV